MVGWIAARDALQRVAVGAKRAKCLLERGRGDEPADTVRIICHTLPEGVEPWLLRVPDAPAHIDLARRQVEVAATRMDIAGVRAAATVTRLLTDPRKARPEIRLVRRLVLGE